MSQVRSVTYVSGPDIMKSGRSGRIRTCDPCVPNAVPSCNCFDLIRFSRAASICFGLFRRLSTGGPLAVNYGATNARMRLRG